MRRRDADHSKDDAVNHSRDGAGDARPRRARRRRTGPGRFALIAPVVLVLALLGTAVAADEYAWGPTYLGWKGGDPDTNPAAVVLPAGLQLPAAAEPEPPAEAAAAQALSPEAVRRALAPALRDRDLGRNVVAAVADLEGNDPVFSRGEGTVVPASTTKLLTAVAALDVLGPGTTFETRVAQTTPDQLFLVGGGDPFLASEPQPNAWPARADVVTLARETAERLRAAQVSRVKLSYDATLFSGPGDTPAWEAGYIPDGVVAPITSLMVDMGHHPRGWGRVDDPARTAADAYADALRDEGIKVSRIRPRATPATATTVAAVNSAPVEDIVRRVVDVSDNEGAEVLAHHVGLARAGEGSFTAGATATLEVLERLGVDLTDVELFDGSGLSRKNRMTARALVDTLRVAANDEHPELRAAVDGLPVAGFTGSLTARFAEGGEEGLGRVRAKTGTLTGVHGLAGIVTSADGVPMVFVVAADRVVPARTLDARQALDVAAAALATCVCAAP